MTDDYETLIGLVRLYSPSGDEQEAVTYLLERMRSLGYENSFRDEVGNAVGTLGQGPKQIVLLGHIDTVPGEIPVRVENGVLYGRGAVDAKGPLASFVEAAAQLGVVPGWQIVVIGAVDEERDSAGARFAVEQFSPDLAIIGEPSRWDRVTMGFKGNLNVMISVKQIVGHTAGPGATACEVILEVWDDIKSWVEEFNRSRERIFDQVQLGLIGMHSDTDGFHEWATLEIGFRLPLDLPPKTLYEDLNRTIRSAEIELVGYPIQAYRAEKNTPLVRAFLGAIRSGGGKPSFVLKSGTADMNIVAPIWQCPVLAYGPGDSGLDHTPNEHLDLDEYTRAVEVLKLSLKRVCQTH